MSFNRLSHTSYDKLSRDEIVSNMRSRVETVVLNTIDSTNSEAKRRAAATIAPLLIVAEHQSEGRGRMGRNFYSPEGTGIYMSLLYKTKEPLCDAVSITTATSVAVARSIEEASGKEVGIKWVNDLYMDEKKICGILCESVFGESGNSIIIGIGINIETVNFPDEIKDIAASTGKLSCSRSRLVALISDRLLEFIEKPDKSYIEEYRKRSILDGKRVFATSGESVIHGKVLGIDDDGGLILLPDGKTAPTVIRSGEVSVALRP